LELKVVLQKKGVGAKRKNESPEGRIPQGREKREPRGMVKFLSGEKRNDRKSETGRAQHRIECREKGMLRKMGKNAGGGYPRSKDEGWFFGRGG